MPGNVNLCAIFNQIPRHFQTILLGQLMSICLCGTAISSQFLSNEKFNAPTAQNLPTYFFLLAIYGPHFMGCKKTWVANMDDDEVQMEGDEDEESPNTMVNILKQRGWKYLALALIDVEANFAMVYAYQFTTITAIQLLDCFTIPIVMALSALFLAARFTRRHYSGVAICLLGLGLTIYTDAFRGHGLEGGSNKLVGDLLCILGTFLYAVANVSEEFLIKQYTRAEYLSMVGLFGFLISSVQVILVECPRLAQFQWTFPTALMYLLFTASMVAFYSLVSVVMRRSSALLFNISVLTSDFYSLLAGVFVFGQKFDLFYLIAFIVIIVGTLIYNYNNSKDKEERTAINNKAKGEEHGRGGYEANLDGATNGIDERF